MLPIHPGVDLFPERYCFFREGLVREIGQQEGRQHQVFRSPELPFQQTEIIIGLSHPVLRFVLQGQHGGQNRADFSTPEFRPESRAALYDFQALLQALCICRFSAGTEDVGAYGMKRAVFPPECFLYRIPVGNIILTKIFQFRFQFTFLPSFIFDQCQIVASSLNSIIQRNGSIFG